MVRQSECRNQNTKPVLRGAQGCRNREIAERLSTDILKTNRYSREALLCSRDTTRLSGESTQLHASHTQTEQAKQNSSGNRRGQHVVGKRSHVLNITVNVLGIEIKNDEKWGM